MRFDRKIRLHHERYAHLESRFHITINAHSEINAWPDGVGESIWTTLLAERDRTSVELFAACLMPDHIHIVLRPDRTEVIRFVAGFKSLTTNRAWSHGVRGSLWQKRWWDRELRPEEFTGAIEYVVRNPVQAGLVEESEQWPWTWVSDNL